MRYVREGWPHNIDPEDIRHYKNLIDALPTENGMPTLWSQDSHPRQIAEQGPGTSTFRPFWYPTNEAVGSLWHHIDKDIERLCRTCNACTEH